MIRYLIALALVMFLPVAAFADITGQPRVIDGAASEIKEGEMCPDRGHLWGMSDK